MYDAIIQRWAQIAESECWAGAWDYPRLWNNVPDDLNDRNEDLHDELVYDNYPDCYFMQAAEEVLGHKLD